MRFALLFAALAGCSASSGGVVSDPPPLPLGLAGEAGAPVELEAGGSPVDRAGAPAGGVAAGGRSHGGAGVGPEAGSVSAGGGASGSAGSPVGGAGSPSTGDKASGGSGGKPVDPCPADFYCHPTGPDAFAKCITRAADPDPEFPGCTITEGACFYPKDAPESCITSDCWSKKRTCP